MNKFVTALCLVAAVAAQDKKVEVKVEVKTEAKTETKAVTPVKATPAAARCVSDDGNCPGDKIIFDTFWFGWAKCSAFVVGEVFYGW